MELLKNLGHFKCLSFEQAHASFWQINFTLALALTLSSLSGATQPDSSSEWAKKLWADVERQETCDRYLEASHQAIFTPEIQKFLLQQYKGDREQALLATLSAHIGRTVTQGRPWGMKTEAVLAADVDHFFSGDPITPPIIKLDSDMRPPARSLIDLFTPEDFSSVSNSDQVAKDLSSLEMTFKNDLLALNERAGQLLEMRILKVPQPVRKDLSRLYVLYAKIHDYDQSYYEGIAYYFVNYINLIRALYYPDYQKDQFYLGGNPEINADKLRTTLASEHARHQHLQKELTAYLIEAEALQKKLQAWGFQSTFHLRALKSPAKLLEMRSAYGRLPERFRRLTDHSEP